MSNRSGRSWYRFSSIGRPTAYSSRDPSSPRYVIEPPLSPTASPSPPPPPRSPPKEVREAKPSPVLSPWPSIKYEAPKRRHERETTSQKILAFSDNTNLVHGPNKEQQQQLDDELSPAAQPSHPPPRLMSPPLRPPSPEEVQEPEPTPVTSSQSLNHEPHKHRQEHETTHQKIILTLSEKTDVVHGPNETLFPESDGDVIMGTQSVITISSENKGAVMEILRSPSKTPGPYLFINDAEKSAEEKSKPEPKSKNHSNNGENRSVNSNVQIINDGENCFVNSNVQIINGSVVYNSSETHHDPGVHLSPYRKPSSGNGFIIKDHGNATPAQSTKV